VETTAAMPHADEPSSSSPAAADVLNPRSKKSERVKTVLRSEQRVIRVFVSSTFLDFHAEREDLVKRVFPELRRRCVERGLLFVEVDLRWGITAEQAARGEVVSTCLAEIDRCRPYFIGLLGERYGWVPADLPHELLERYEWLKDCRGRSVTELEILHGVLNVPHLERRAYFYFRDPTFGPAVGPQPPSDAESHDVAIQHKLDDLKQRIRLSSARVYEHYDGPKSVGDLIFADLSASIDAHFPLRPAEPFERTAAQHAAFAAVRARNYVGRAAYSGTVDAHAQRTGPPLAVLGDQGAGKSALLANWTQQYSVSHPGDFVLAHFIGADSESADCVAMIRRVVEAFNREFSLTIQLPDSVVHAHAALARALLVAGHRQSEKGGRIVLVIDGLDQLEDSGGAPDLVWLPETIPDEIRVIVSTLPGRALTEITRRNWPTLLVEPLSVSEREEVIDQYLGDFSKRLGNRVAEQIAAASQTANPLFLRALLEELRVWGVHERLDERINHYLKAATARDLFGRILERYEEDYESDRAELVRDALSMLWAARRGLSEPELLAMLGAEGRPLPRATWSPLFLAAASGLVDRDGLLGYFHEQFEEAVRERYVEDPPAIHRRLAEYFTGVALSVRKVEELPWHLARAGDLDRLFAVLSDLEFFRAASGLDYAQIMQHWAMLERAGYSMRAAYREVIEHPGEHLASVTAVSRLLNETGHFDDCSALYEELIKHHRQSGDKAQLSSTLDNHANLLARRGRLSEAADLLNEQRGLLDDESQDPRGWEGWYGTMALVVWEQGDSTEAWRLLTNQERLLRGLRDNKRLDGCLIQKSFVLYARHDFSEAIRLLREAYRLAQESDDTLGLQACLGELAINYQGLGDLERAAELLRQQADICRQAGDRESLAGAVGNLGGIYLRRGDWQAALEMFEEMEQIGKAIGHGRIEHVGRTSKAQAQVVGGKLSGAEESIGGVPEYFRQAGMTEPLNDALRVVALIRRAKEQAAAKSDPGEALDMARQRADADPTDPDAQLILGDALKRARLHDDAMAAYRRALALRPDWDEAELKLADLILSKEFNH
jgi:tetratricopeptide (TPR) repeat protein